MTTTPMRYRGCLTGLAVGDAVGTTVEFREPGSFPPATDMVGGGPFARTGAVDGRYVNGAVPRRESDRTSGVRRG